MSSSHDIKTLRRWMYQRIDPYTKGVSIQFQEGLDGFISFAKQNMYEGDQIWCPCKKCKTEKMLHVDLATKHLFNKGFTPNYYVWTAHGEEYERVYNFPGNDEGGEENTFQGSGGGWNFCVDMNDAGYVGDMHGQHESVHIGGSGEPHDENDGEHVDEVPNEEAEAFFKNLHAASQPLYDGCIEGLTRFSLASDVMNVKMKHNESEASIDDWSHVIHKVLPQGNVAPRSYYETEKLMRTLSMKYHRIDVCQNNCMIYWGDRRDNLLNCEFCDHPRYKPETLSRKKAGKSKPSPYKKMFYLPISCRLKKLYL